MSLLHTRTNIYLSEIGAYLRPYSIPSSWNSIASPEHYSRIESRTYTVNLAANQGVCKVESTQFL